jgi:flavin reductase (DIM6/NTAB) family NADH-FMN oxidoreductase RutF
VGSRQAPLDDGIFRDIMACFPSGVAIVTTRSEGDPRGLTVSSFCSVSRQPPLVLVCVDRSSNTLPALIAGGGFTVNFLAEGSEQLASHFASKAEDKFSNLEWTAPTLAEGGPILSADSSAYAVCLIRQKFMAGDHWVFLGEVREGAVVKGRLALVYHQRTYVSIQPR